MNQDDLPNFHLDCEIKDRDNNPIKVGDTLKNVKDGYTGKVVEIVTPKLKAYRQFPMEAYIGEVVIERTKGIRRYTNMMHEWVICSA
jgi:hypothetical protein